MFTTYLINTVSCVGRLIWCSALDQLVGFVEKAEFPHLPPWPLPQRRPSGPADVVMPMVFVFSL